MLLYSGSMTGAHSPEAALARWLAQGATSHTHRVLQRVLRDFFAPLGIQAEALEAEPFSALESGQGTWWLRQPRWSPDGFDRGRGAEPDFRFLLDAPERFAVTVDPQGGMFIEVNSAGGPHPAPAHFAFPQCGGCRGGS